MFAKLYATVSSEEYKQRILEHSQTEILYNVSNKPNQNNA